MSSDSVAPESAYGDPDTRSHILDVTWKLIAEQGSSLKLTTVAKRASVSRQAVYLHFGDRTGLLVALVDHMDQTLDLGAAIAAVQSAPDGAAMLEATMALNTTFWRQVQPVAQVLEAAQYTDDALGAAWRDRMAFRQATFRSMIEVIAQRGELDDAWTIDDASTTLYGIAHFDTWRELIGQGWNDDRYVETMSRVLTRALLSG